MHCDGAAVRAALLPLGIMLTHQSYDNGLPEFFGEQVTAVGKRFRLAMDSVRFRLVALLVQFACCRLVCTRSLDNLPRPAAPRARKE